MTLDLGSKRELFVDSYLIDRLEEAAGSRATDLIWIGVRPVYDPLRGSPRFDAIQSLMGLA